MKKYENILFYSFKGLLTALMLMSASMYLFNHDMVVGFYKALGFPTYLIYPLAIAKILGLLALWIPLFKRFQQWAYAGFFYDLLLAIISHLAISDGEHMGAVLGLIFVIVAHFYENKRDKLTK